MRAEALARALKDFGVRPPPAAEPFDAPAGFDAPACGPPAPFDPPPEPVEQVDVEELVASAVAEAEAALAARLGEQHAAALQAERDRHGEEMQALQAEFAEEAGAKILAGIAEMENRLVELTSAVTARILGVTLTDAIRERSIERLVEIIRAALNDDEAVRVRVRGSLALYESLKLKLPGYADQLDFAESAHFDLSVAIDDSVFETRLAEWSAALAEALS